MTEKIATPKTGTTKPTRKAPAVRKTPLKKTPAAKTDVTETKVEKENKIKRIKVVRDSFSMPQSDYAKIGELKQLCLKNGFQAKKSELLRAGLHALGKLSAAQLKAAVASLEKIETGRPKKS